MRRRAALPQNIGMRPPVLIATLLAVLLAVVLLTRFMWAFQDWNREQACATGGGRNCGGHYSDDR